MRRYLESQRIVEKVVPVEMMVPVQQVVANEVPVYVDKYIKQPAPFDVEKVEIFTHLSIIYQLLNLLMVQIVIKEVSVPVSVEKVSLVPLAEFIHFHLKPCYRIIISQIVPKEMAVPFPVEKVRFFHDDLPCCCCKDRRLALRWKESPAEKP